MRTPRLTQAKKYAKRRSTAWVLFFEEDAVVGGDHPEVRALPALDCDARLDPGKSQLVHLTTTDQGVQAIFHARLGGDPARDARGTVAAALRWARTNRVDTIAVVTGDRSDLTEAAAEAFLLAAYRYEAYKSEKSTPVDCVLLSTAPTSIVRRTKVLCTAINFARDCQNAPPAAAYPAALAEQFSDFAKASGLEAAVWDERKLKREKCGGILAVGKGSATGPRLVVGTWSPPKARAHIALVGKGVTFDSGGYSLKPPKSMEDMKFDMSGAAMMWGAACAIASLKIPVRVTVLCPLAHNAVSGNAYTVSDIVTTRSGKTIEVLNTDAEGRIILADALTLAAERNPDVIVDAATLTGAAVVALGEDMAAVYGTDDGWTQRYLDAAAAVDEPTWRMPLYTPYREMLDSKIADIKNVGERWGGSITAALFLKEFVPDVPWIHVDIAGPGCKVKPWNHLGHGGKGYGVKSVTAFAQAAASGS